ncbi:hypothetical protein ACTFIR_007090 [Dictyostelium discoideum]
MRFIVLLVALFALLSVSNAISGVDISSGSSVPDFTCLKSAGYEFAIIRGWESIGQPDANGPHSVYNARDAGFEYVDIYLFPCYSCGNGAGQGEALVNYMKGYNANYGMVWLDIEGPGEYWSDDQGANAAFFESLVSGLESAGAHIGVYTSESQWSPIMGGYTGGSKFPLWYAHYDGNPSFSDFSGFGGWSSPAIKQYDDTGDSCGLGFDLNCDFSGFGGWSSPAIKQYYDTACEPTSHSDANCPHSVYNARDADEFDCLINIINKFNYKTFDSYKDITKICSLTTWVSCDPTSGSVKSFILSNLQYNNNEQAISSDFSCLPNIETLAIYYQNVSKDLIYFKSPKLTKLTFSNTQVLGGAALDQPFEKFDDLSISNCKGLDINTPFKFSYFNKVTRFILSGLYAQLEFDSLAFKNKTFFHLSGLNYPDLTGYTGIQQAEFEFDDTFKLDSISNFAKYTSFGKLIIYHYSNNVKIPFYFSQNTKLNSLWLTTGGSIFTSPYETPTTMIDLSSTRYTDFLLGGFMNENLNGKFPFIMPSTCSNLNFNSNNLTILPNDIVCKTVSFQNNGLNSELPKFIGKSDSYDLKNNKFTGIIDQSWCSTELVINNNKLIGKIPSCYSCYLNAPKPSGGLVAMYDRFTGGNSFTNLNKTAVTCTTFAPQVKWLSSNSIGVTGIDIGFDPNIWLFNGGVKVMQSINSSPGQYPQLILYSPTLTGETFTINFQYPINYVFTFPKVSKNPLVTSASINGKLYTFNGTYFSSHMRHQYQDIRIKGSLCTIVSTDFYSVSCSANLVIDSALKMVNITTGQDYNKKTTVYIRIDGLVSNDHRCSNDCSGNQGICDLSTGTCYCEPGYSGSDCSFKNCGSSVPECNGAGTCNGATGLCTCDSTHVGDYCQYSTSACPNNCGGSVAYGTCNANKTCTCNAGFAGVDCSKATQCVNNCSGNGTCVNGVCQCFDGYGDSSCSAKILYCPVGAGGTPCNGFYGTCNPSTGVCTCRDGYQGSACDDRLIQCPVAMNSIVCNRLDINWCDTTTGKCQCDPNFQGTDCSLPFIQCPLYSGKVCGGFGACNNQTGVCTCDGSHQGVECSVPFIQCPLNGGKVCGGFGTCNNQTGVCTCDGSHQGTSCSLPFVQCPISFLNPCGGSKRGICNNQIGVCTCLAGYQGADCSLPLIKCPTINSNDCSGFGSCNNQTGLCACDSSHQSSDCSLPFIQCPLNGGKVCSNFGTCNNQIGVCTCDDSHQGTDCSKNFVQCPTINSNSCSGFGSCNNETGVCSCNSGRLNNDCSGIQCDVPNCNSHGTCDTTIGKCQCDSSHQGSDCSTPFIDCPSINLNDCSGFGSCNNQTGTCTCNSGKTLSDCTGIQCSVPDCNGHGTCDTIVGKCQCDSSHQGNDCNIPLIQCPSINLNGCSGFGSCNNQTGVCSCDSSHQGSDCSSPFVKCPTVNSNDCSDFGSCNNQTGSCSCDSSHQGADCSLPFIQCPMYSNSLCGGSSFGSCNNQTGVCTCDSSQQGADCSLPLTQCPSVNSKDCSGFGSCNNETGICSCNLGRLNNDCSGIQCGSPNCNGHGTCDTTIGVCQCDSSHQGNDCSLPFIECPSINSNDCSGFGSCNNQTGACSCNSGRALSDCSGIQCDVPNCNSHGTCDITIGKCQCLKNTWSGSDCSIPYQVIRSVNESTTAGGEATFEGIFGDVHQGIKMQIGGIDCPIVFNSSTIIKCMAPEGNGIKKVTLFQNDIYYTYDKYKYKTIELSCPSNCLGNGICNTSTGECKCNSGYGSYDCSPIINNGGGGLGETPNSNSNSGELVIPPKSNTTLNEGTGGTNIVNQKTNFEIYFKSLYEIDYSGQIVKTYLLENNWKVNHDSNGQYTFNQTIDNGCIITSRIDEINDENGKEFEFAGTSFTVSNGGIKFTVTIDNYQYQSNLNTLTLDFVSSVDEIQDTQNNNECNSKDTEIDTSNVNDLSSSNFNYIKISKNNKILSGRFINRLLSNGKATFFSTSVRNESNSIIVSLNLPHCSQCIIDPDFSVLLSSDFVSNCPSVVDKRKSYIIPVAVVASVVGAVSVASAGFLIRKKMIERKFFKTYSN